MKKEVLVIVAHPDDELIWMGGTLLRNKDKWNTTLICLTRASDKDRYPKFLKACKELGISKPFIFDLNDENFNPIPRNKIIKTIESVINDKIKYDYIYTHGKDGEYGHIRHIETHKAINEMLKKGKLKAKNIFYFSYLKKENDYQGYAIPKLNKHSTTNNFIKLKRHEVIIKKNIITKIYGYGNGGFEEKSSGNIESFKKL